MKFSYNWLQELVPSLAIPPRELMSLITMKTAECEGVEEFGGPLREASAARVLSVEPLPGSHNVKAVVETERYGTKTVVCGAPNCRAGLMTAYLPVGKAVIHGVESDGMLASGKELGIDSDHSGIVELAGGLSLKPDHIIEVDNKSLTHRPDLWGHYGMAREVAAITQGTLHDPVGPPNFENQPCPIRIAVENAELCPRYSALVVDNISVAPSPQWLRYRLEAVGLNPISNIVDITNYVLAELPQPMHAFDADKLHGDTIFIRSAKQGESIKALNGETYSLGPENLVIADEAGPIAVAGVIGGADSAIGPGTKRIVFESANFHAASVRKTSSALKLRTDASMRFEKSQDPVNTMRGLQRAADLLQAVAPGARIVGGPADAAAPARTLPPIDLSVDWVAKKLGRAVTAEEIRSILDSLEFGVLDSVPGVFRVTVPSWRATKDINLREDLLEEVGRMLGYGSITPAAPLVEATVPPPSPQRLYTRRIRELAVDEGYTEVSNYSFISDDMARVFGENREALVGILNPIAAGQSYMRSSLLPGMWRNVQENSKHFASFRLFEIGREIHARPQGLPDETPHFAAVVYAREGDGFPGLLEARRLAECIVPGCTARAAQARTYEHPERAADLELNGEQLGRIFEFHPNLIPEGRAAVLHINLLITERLTAKSTRYVSLRRFPTSAFDLSVICALREPVGRLRELLLDEGGADLIALEYVRQYTGPPLPLDTKSVSFRLTAGAKDRTMSSDEVAAIRDRLIAAMRKAGYDLRV